MATILSRTKPETPAAELTRPSKLARRRGRWFGRALWILVGLVVVVGLALAWRPKPVPVDTATVTRGDLVVSVDEVGRTRVRDRYVVASPLAGTLVRIELRAGDRVQSGDVLARITPHEAPMLDPRARAEAAARSAAASAGEQQARAAASRAEAAAAHANEDLERTRRLAQSGSVSRDLLADAELEARVRSEELASARFALQMSAHEAAMARATLARFTKRDASEGFDVPAPVTGTVLRVVAQSAGPVQPGAALVELGDPTALEVVVDLLSADAVRIAPGSKVVLERWGGAPLRAHVRRIEPSGFTRLSALGVEEQRVPVVVDIDSPRSEWEALGDGFRVEARVVVEEKRGVLRAPIGALFRRGDAWAAYVVDRGGRARVAQVAVAAKSDVEVEVTGGLAEGDVVVLHPGEAVEAGKKVVRRAGP